MPRIRSIKPDFWKSEAIAMHPHRTRLTFIGLWTYVDDNGVGLDNEKLITAELFALEDDPREALANVREDLARLHAAGRISRYTVDGKRYLAITNWDLHQKVDRAGKPRYPQPTNPSAVPLGSGNANGALALVESSRKSREDLATPPLLVKGVEGLKGAGVKDLSSSDTAAQTPDGDSDDEPLDAEESEPDLPAKYRPHAAVIEALCDRLADRIHENRQLAGSAKPRPTIGQKWRVAAGRMLVLDGLTATQIETAIDWCQQDEFWAPNIESMSKLREQFDKLRAAAIQRPAGRAVVTRSSQHNGNQDMLQRAMARAEAKEASGL